MSKVPLTAEAYRLIEKYKSTHGQITQEDIDNHKHPEKYFGNEEQRKKHFKYILKQNGYERKQQMSTHVRKNKIKGEKFLLSGDSDVGFKHAKQFRVTPKILLKFMEISPKIETTAEWLRNKVNGKKDRNNYLKAISKKLDIENIFFAMARHTFATNFLNKDGEMLQLMQILGHSKSTTTLNYIHKLKPNKSLEIMKLI